MNEEAVNLLINAINYSEEGIIQIMEMYKANPTNNDLAAALVDSIENCLR